ncbi:glycoside hydrolase family 140 protein [Parabacteroides pacaensis]|uniref:glycoside hydrolase family 140 protein n=1 Tax=Parabacteroides pacaensis TaxID=2086575 RepID=UPI000D0F96FF|nr:glycoside hydrolase family 140 protein [Parabacteroides pacaensis]
MKTLLLTCFCYMITFPFIHAQEVPWQGKSVDFSHGKLTISQNGRFLSHIDGTPFFYLGDTAWELLHLLNETDVEKYLENRRTKGFTVIQTVILSEFDGLTIPNHNNQLPLLKNNPDKPNEAYFKWIDKIIQIAEEKGLFIGLLPTWGDKVDKQWGKGPVIFNKTNAFKYGQFLGNRYKNYPNIIWINGGDRNGGNNIEVWDALAEGIKSKDPNHLMTFHPLGEESSSTWFHNRNWLDFNSFQSGHAQRSYDIYNYLVVRDYNKQPIKPCIDMEPRYEDHPVCWLPETYGWFDDVDVRQSLYWSLFSGTCGYTYGCHPVWQFKTDQRTPLGFARHNWQEAINFTGAGDVIHARRLLESYDYYSRVPDQSIILWEQKFATNIAVATRGNGYAFVYLPNGYDMEVSLERIPGAKQLMLKWFNPRTGEITPIKTIPAKGKYWAKSPKAGRGNDWILIMEAI